MWRRALQLSGRIVRGKNAGRLVDETNPTDHQQQSV